LRLELVVVVVVVVKGGVDWKWAPYLHPFVGVSFFYGKILVFYN
jgi:hypothetical protein